MHPVAKRRDSREPNTLSDGVKRARVGEHDPATPTSVAPGPAVDAGIAHAEMAAERAAAVAGHVSQELLPPAERRALEGLTASLTASALTGIGAAAHDAIEHAGRHHIEFGGFLSNHLAHGAIALAFLGGETADSAGRIAEFMAAYAPRLEPPQRAQSEQAGDHLRGARVGYAERLALERAHVARLGIDEALRARLPATIEGCVRPGSKRP